MTREQRLPWPDVILEDSDRTKAWERDNRRHDQQTRNRQAGKRAQAPRRAIRQEREGKP